MINRIKSFLILLFLSTFIVAQPSEQIEKIDKLFSESLDQFEMAGLAVGIIKEGKILLSKGYGFLEYGKERKVNEETIFEIASCSKAFTATALGILVDEGLINWEDRVVDYLPGFQLFDSYVTREMRIVDLLCHRAGFNTFDGDLLWYNTNYSRKEVVERIRHLPLKNSFRMTYGYSNVMYIVAGEVIEAVTGKTWDEFVTEKILVPLEMTSTKTTNNAFTRESNKALPHLDRTPLEFLNYDNSGPAASLNSNINDMLKWLRMWTSRGKVGEKNLISEETYHSIIEGQIVSAVRGGDKAMGIDFKEYALGWGTFEYEGVKVVSHTGGLPGYLSRVAFVPELNLGFVFLYNNMSYILNAGMYAILDAFLKEDIGDHFAKTKKMVDQYAEVLKEENEKRNSSRVQNTKHSLPLEGYSGTYTDKMYGEATVEFKEGKLILTLVPAKKHFTAELKHWHYNTFDFKFNDPFLPNGFATFEFDSEGMVTGFRIDLPNPDFHFYNLHFVKAGEKKK